MHIYSWNMRFYIIVLQTDSLGILISKLHFQVANQKIVESGGTIPTIISNFPSLAEELANGICLTRYVIRKKNKNILVICVQKNLNICRDIAYYYVSLIIPWFTKSMLLLASINHYMPYQLTLPPCTACPAPSQLIAMWVGATSCTNLQEHLHGTLTTVLSIWMTDWLAKLSAHKMW